MTQPNPENRNPKPKYNSEQLARLKAEAEAPYRTLRKFIYLAFGASGLIGLFIFALQLLAGKNVEQGLPNLAIQVGVVALMTFLWKLEQGKGE